MKKYINSGRAGSLFATLLFCLVSLGSAQAQEASADDAIEVVREGIAHDALYAIEISGESGFASSAAEKSSIASANRPSRYAAKAAMRETVLSIPC